MTDGKNVSQASKIGIDLPAPRQTLDYPLDWANGLITKDVSGAIDT